MRNIKKKFQYNYFLFLANLNEFNDTILKFEIHDFCSLKEDKVLNKMDVFIYSSTQTVDHERQLKRES